MCAAGQFNLSYDSLTSYEARRVLRDLPNTDPTFFAEISQPRSRAGHAVPILNECQTQQEDSEHTYVAVGDHGLSSAAEAEDVLVESVNACVMDVSGAFTGRPKRKCRGNVLYAGKNWLDSDKIDA